MRHLFLFLAVLSVGQIVAQKLAPNTEAFLLRPEGRDCRAVSDTVVKVYVEINDASAENAVVRLGGKVYFVTENFLTAAIPLAVIREVAALPQVAEVQIASPVKPYMEKARNLGNADLAHSASNPLGNAYMGRDVVVGIIDNGFEYGHAAYYAPDGKRFRIKRVWNQNLNSGTPPSNFGYGTEYASEAAILAAKYDVSTTYHGGHVAGIAAGGDMTKPYYGVSPEADLVLVSNGPTNVDVTNAVKYIFEYAESVGKPCVINMSIGTHYGPHDGTSASDRLFDEMSGEGRLLVGAGGNEGSVDLHLGKTFSEDDLELKTMIGYADESNRQALVDIWGIPGKHFTVQGVVVDLTKGRIVASTDAVSSTELGSYQFFFTTKEVGADAYFTIVSQSVASNNLRPNIYVETTANYLAANRKLGLVVRGEDGGEVHLWNCSYGPFISGNKKGWTPGDSRYTVSELGGTARSVITVGSFNSNFRFKSLNGSTYMVSEENDLYDLSSFSSCGPTLDGRMKPDVTAPGWCVVSAAMRHAIKPSEAIASTTLNGETYYYEINGGTSMAAPYVTGSLALWLEAEPALNPQQVRDLIKTTAAHDDCTGDLPNVEWGYGKMDTYAGLAKILGDDTGLHLTEHGLSKVGYAVHAEAAELHLTFPQDMGRVEIDLFSSAGRLLKKVTLPQTFTGMKYVLSTVALSEGIYLVRLRGTHSAQSFKVIL